MANQTGRGNHGDQGFGDDDGHHAERPVTFDQLDTTTYLHSDNAADGSFVEHFILQVNGFELDGSPVTLPGFGSAFGMYFLIDATGQTANGATTFNSMNIALMVDRGNNDGAPSSTEFGGTTFANGTRGDYTLATGTLVSAGIDVDPATGTRHPHFIERITPTEAGERVFGTSLNQGALLQELLTTPGGPTVFDAGGGNTIQIVDGKGAGGGAATGIAELDPQGPLSVRPGALHEAGGMHGFGHWSAYFH